MSFIRTILGSFYSADLYAAVKRMPNYRLGYSFALVVITSLLVTLSFTQVLHRELFVARGDQPPAFDQVVHQIAEQMPLMTMSGNRLETKEARVYPINIDIELFGYRIKGTFITIDTTGATGYENMRTPLLITASGVIYKSKSKTEVKTFSELNGDQSGTLIINRAMIEDTAQRLIQAVHSHILKFYLIVGGFGWLGYALVLYVMRICMLLVLGAGGLIIGNAQGSTLSFATTTSLAAVSYTVVTLADTLMLLIWGKGAHVIVLFICGLIMLGAALTATRDEPLAEPQ